MHKEKVLKLAKGFYGRSRHCIRLARNRVEKSLLHSYIGRKLKKRDYRSLWITRINAGARLYDMQYGRFMNGLKQSNIELNRKMLSELAANEPLSFRSVVEQVRLMVGIPEKKYPAYGYVASSLQSNLNPKYIDSMSWRSSQVNLQRKHNLEHWKQQLQEEELKKIELLQQEAAKKKMNQ